MVTNLIFSYDGRDFFPPVLDTDLEVQVVRRAIAGVRVVEVPQEDQSL